jgi:hypothetical protein
MQTRQTNFSQLGAHMKAYSTPLRKAFKSHAWISVMALVPGVLAFSVSSCGTDTVHEGAVAALEAFGEGKYPGNTEFHRGGQPCLTCHGPQGPAKTRYVAAGTVYWGTCNPPSGDKVALAKRNEWCQLTPAAGAQVRITDSRNVPKCFKTNCAGNFYVSTTAFGSNSNGAMTFPLLTSVAKIAKVGGVDTAFIKPMGGHIGRAGSCADCHRQEGFADSPGQIYLVRDIHKVEKSTLPDEFTNAKGCDGVTPVTVSPECNPDEIRPGE